MNYPVIRFNQAWLLINTIYRDIKPAYEKPEDELHKLEPEYIARALRRYEKAWRPYEDQIIHGMCELLDLEFRQNIIDIYAAPFYNSFSNPMFIATKYASDRAVEVMAHEIIHRLLSDNKQVEYGTKLTPEWKKLFGKQHSQNTLIHIAVHATLQGLFDDVIDEPERTVRDKKKCENYPDYKAAWEYVEEVGHRQIIEMLKESYVRLSKK